jgi:hypothetical protein
MSSYPGIELKQEDAICNPDREKRREGDELPKQLVRS